MKAATVNELKQELKHQSAAELIELCSRLARFKKENKELLTYLLFEAHDETAYVKSVKAETEFQFAEIPRGNSLYLQKKSVRKILRIINKHVRYMGNKEAEADLILFFCTQLKDSGITIKQSTALLNLYNNQVKKTEKLVKEFHEDLQYDYLRQIEELKLK